MTRPVYVTIGEVPRPSTSVAAIIHTPDATTLRVHPGVDVPEAAHDINHLLTGEEFHTWIVHYLGHDLDLRARFRASPHNNIPAGILRIPILAPYIPYPLRAPGVSYT